jgi:O-antigen ligase
MSPALLILPLVILPLFVCLPNGELPILHLFGYYINRDSISLNLNVIHCVYGVVLLCSHRLDRRLAYFLVFSVAWLGASLVCGLTYEFSLTNVAFYVQTVLPMFAIPYGYYLIRKERDVERVIHFASATMAIFLCFLTVVVMLRFGATSLLFERLRVMAELEYALPQFKSYFPIAVQFTFSLALAEYLFGNPAGSRVAFLILSAHALIVPFCWSRAGLLGIVFCGLVQFVLTVMIGKSAYIRRALGLAVAGALMLPVLFAQMGTTVSSRTDVADLNNDSDIRRLELVIEGAQRIYERPLFGDMFVPSWDERVGGEDIDVKRLFGAHNQYIDMGLRGGILYLIVLGALVYSTLVKARKLTRFTMSNVPRSYLVLGAASCSYVLATLVSSNFQLYLIQLQTAVPFYLMIGVTFRTWRLAMTQMATNSQRMPGRPVRVPVATGVPVPTTRTGYHRAVNIT